jgi:hypothetical protein
MTLRRLGQTYGTWTARPLVADDILEFHAARLLLLLRHCGTKNRIEGLTKLAKLDFFVRYPAFFKRVASADTEATRGVEESTPPESAMVRHHYGPWDHRYYQVLAFLEACSLVSISTGGHGYVVGLTSTGIDMANGLTGDDPFRSVVDHMKQVKARLGRRSGSSLKRMVYRQFDKEVAALHLGAVI